LSTGLYCFLCTCRGDIIGLAPSVPQISEVILVTYDKDGIRDREESMGFETARELGAEKLTVITWYLENEETKSGIRVHYIPLWKWLLRP